MLNWRFINSKLNTQHYLKVFPQVHALIQRSDLVAVAIKRKRFALQEFSDAPLGRLAAARVIDLGVDVGIEAVIRRSGLHPRGRRLLLAEANLHDRLDALESVLPRHDDADRRAVLIRQRLALKPGAEGREAIGRAHG